MLTTSASPRTSALSSLARWVLPVQPVAEGQGTVGNVGAIRRSAETASFSTAADEDSLKADDESIPQQAPAQAGLDLQSKIDAAIAGGKPATVIVPAGDYFFNRSLTISGARALKLVGSGQSNFYFDWRDHGAGVLFNRSSDVQLSGLSADQPKGL